ncbi:MAG TPA: hypothetical protein VK907_09780 [Phnomibacter sp.]|nr:hypothetical protein [Phnomibacter sp.]
MRSISAAASLQAKIETLESLQTQQLQEIQQQFHFTADKLKPSKLIANTLREAMTPSDTGSSNIIDSTLGLATGFLTRKLLFGSSPSPVKKAIGSVVQFGLSNLVYKNSIGIKAIGGVLYKWLFRKPRTEDIKDSTVPVG